MSEHVITQNDIDQAINFTQKVIDECGVRLPGSEGVQKAADVILNESLDFEDAKKEEFVFAPDAFFGFFDIFVGCFILGTIFLFFGGVWLYVSLGVLTLGSFAAISQFVFYWGYFDIFYPKKKGYNVVGVINPPNKADVKQEIIVCGHHDSAWIVNFLKDHQKLYSIRLILGAGYILVVNALVIILALIYAITGNDSVPFLTNFVKYGALVGFFFSVPLLWYRDRKKGTYGAGDNLISSVMALQISKILNNAKKSGKSLLKNTRVRFISFDGEEAALKGSKAYVKLHKDELLSIPTYAICPDCIYNMKHLKVLTGDQNGIYKAPPEIVNETKNIAKELGYNPAVDPWPFGGGASDAASFLKIGVPAVTLMGMSTEMIRDDLVQHTEQDLVENIDREIIEAVMKIMMTYILKKDQEISK